MTTLKDVAINLLRSSFNAQKGENLLVVSDTAKKSIGEAIWEAGIELGLESVHIVMTERQLSGEEPPRTVAKAMQGADIILAPTQKSITHTNARIDAVKQGARMATMPGITEDMFIKGAMTADYEKVKALTEDITALLTKAEKATIIKDNTKLEISLKGRNGVSSSGVYREKGESGNLPSGEAYIAPLEDGANGDMIIDGSMVGIGKLNSPLHMTIKEGKLVSVTGEKSENLDILLRTKENATLCELGIGTNDAAILNGIILEDEKVYATVHIAFGTNTSFGGINKAECHFDGIILEPTLYLDDILVLEKGNFKV